MAEVGAVGPGSGLPGWIYLVQGRKPEADLDCVEAEEQFSCHDGCRCLVSGRERRARADVLQEERLAVPISRSVPKSLLRQPRR